MTKANIAQWDTTAANNTDINDISLAENVMKPPAVNNAFRETMAQIAQWTGEGTIASAATCDIGAEDEEFLNVTGTTTITSFGTVRAGTVRRLLFADALTLTHNATSLILPGSANITTAAGDVAVMISEGSGNWRCVAYTPADGVFERIKDFIGANSTWQDVTASRVSDGTAYQNTTGKIIEVLIWDDVGAGDAARFDVSTDGSTWVSIGYPEEPTSGSSGRIAPNGPWRVMPGWYYRCSTGTSTVDAWKELR